MTLRGVLDVVLTDPGVARVAAAAGSAHLAVTAPPSVQPLVAAALAARGGGDGVPVLVVTAGERDADAVAEQLRCFLPDRRVATFPAWETLPHERLSPRADTVGRRLAVLRDLAHPGGERHRSTSWSPRCAACCSRSPPAWASWSRWSCTPGDTAELDDVARALSDAAYTRVDLVEKRGEFAVRGGLLDVFPPTEPHPVRVEFWGDEVDELRYFSAADQRSLDERPERLWAPPCRELLLTDEVRARAAELAVEHPGLLDVLGRLAEGIAVEGMESLTPRPARRGGHAAAHRPRAARARTCWSATPSGCAAAPRTWCAPPRSSSPPPGRRRPAPPTDRRGAAGPRRVLLPRPRGRRGRRPRPRAAVVDHRGVHPAGRRRRRARDPRRRARRALPRRPGPRRRAAARLAARGLAGRWSPSPARGPAQRAADQLARGRPRRPARARRPGRAPTTGLATITQGGLEAGFALPGRAPGAGHRVATSPGSAAPRCATR